MWPEDWSNDAENTALITEINNISKYIEDEICYLMFNKILPLYCICD